MDKKINITLCCPSRGRPYYAKRMQDSALQTAKHPDKIKIKFYLNQDDPELKNYQCIDYEVGIDRSTVMSWNLLAEKERIYYFHTRPPHSYSGTLDDDGFFFLIGFI